MSVEVGWGKKGVEVWWGKKGGEQGDKISFKFGIGQKHHILYRGYLSLFEILDLFQFFEAIVFMFLWETVKKSYDYNGVTHEYRREKKNVSSKWCVFQAEHFVCITKKSPWLIEF